MAEPNGAGLESQVGTVSRAEGIRHDPRRKTHSDSLGAHNMWPLGSLPLSEAGKRNTVHYRVCESVQDQRMQGELERKAALRSR